MHHHRLTAAGLMIAFSWSCASNTNKPAAAPAPSAGSGTAQAPAARPAAPTPPVAPTPPEATGAGRAGGPPGGPPRGGFPGGGRGRVQLTPEQMAARRDSLSAERTAVLQDLMTRIAGSENKRADDEFTNIKLMKDTTAAQLLKVMDYFGKSLSVGCQYCHVAGNKWDDDSKEEKNTARVMIQLVDLINTQGLSKLPPNRSGRTPTISCVTCHRGRTTPGQMLLP